MMAQIDERKIISELKSMTFIAPIAQLFAIVSNSEYDIKSYSEELDNKHINWDYDNDKGPLFWQEFDEFNNYCEEPKEHKIWRLNHNKKYKTMKIMTIITPKKVSDGVYKIDEKSLNEIVNRFNSYVTYAVSNK